jgi:uncharacterized surface protein with fasciclin (FAS1) repeats
MEMKKVCLLLLLMPSICAVALCQSGSSALKDLSSRLGDDGRHGVLIALLRTAEKQDTSIAALFGGGPHTVLAPSDEAFARLPQGMLEKLRSNKLMLREFLLAHIIIGKVMIAEMLVPVKGSPGKTLVALRTLNGDVVSVLSNAQTGEHHPVVNGKARIGNSDIPFLGGVIHEIDAALISHRGWDA